MASTTTTTTTTLVASEIVIEKKTRSPSWKTLTSRVASLTLGPGPDSLTKTEPPQAQSIAEKPIRNRSTSGTSATSDDPTVVDFDNDQAGEQLVDQATNFVDIDDKIPDDLPPLSKPIVIPRLCKGSTPPLARVWPPEVVDHAISQHDFVTFIDNLNIVSRAPPATIILQLAAVGISVIPYDGAEGIAALTELSALAIGYALVVRRCKRFLDKMNADYFHVRRLHARLVGTKTMRKILGIAKDDPLVAPLSEDTLEMTAYERCMAQLQAYTCELSHDVPEPSRHTELLERLAAWKLQHDLKVFDKAAKRARKRAWKRKLKGKKTKWEGWHEKSRVKRLQWLLIQNLDDFEREQAEEKEVKKMKRGFTWNSQMSSDSNDQEVKNG